MVHVQRSWEAVRNHEVFRGAATEEPILAERESSDRADGGTAAYFSK